MTHQIVRFVDDEGQVQVGYQDRSSGAIHRIEVDSIAELLTYSSSQIKEILHDAIHSPSASTTSMAERELPPVDHLTEVWASGVTYKRSRTAREEESDHADVYSRVYDADRPELFFKSVAWRVVGNNEPIGVRIDSPINTPEPELALVINSRAEIVGVTICNDVSSRSIEGENPLYLPQAKVYTGACSVGPVIVPVWNIKHIHDLEISAKVERNGEVIWQASTSTAQIHRQFEDLVDYLFLQMQFPHGVILSTGTGIVPEMDFDLSPGDRVTIEISEIGELSNPVTNADHHSFAWLTPNPNRHP